MTLSVTHTKVVTTTDDGTSEVGSDEWNAGHSISGATQNTILFADDTTSISSMAGTSWDDTNRSLTLTGATVTTNKPIFDLSQTWNGGAVTFTGLNLVVTDTASAAGSKLLDLQTGAGSQFMVRKDGTFTFGYCGFTTASGTLYALKNDLANFAQLIVGPLKVNNDVNLSSDGANILNQSNGGAAQTLRVYNTYNDASNYERGVLDWTTTSNTLTIGTQAAGTGTLRGVNAVGVWNFTGHITGSGATVTTSTPVLDLSQTWNDGAVTFTGLKFNVTNTASAAGSLLLDLQVGGTTALSVDTTPFLKIGSGNTTSRGWIFGYASASGYSGVWNTGVTPSATNFNILEGSGNLYLNDDTSIRLRIGNTDVMSVVSNMVLLDLGMLSFDSGQKTILAADADYILAQRKTTNAQTFRVYNTYTDASNYERLVFDWATSANVATIDVQVAGTGTQRVISLNHLDAATAGGTATFAATNCPATTLTSPYTWIKVTSSDGSIVYMPAWK